MPFHIDGRPDVVFGTESEARAFGSGTLVTTDEEVNACWSFRDSMGKIFHTHGAKEGLKVPPRAFLYHDVYAQDFNPPGEKMPDEKPLSLADAGTMVWVTMDGLRQKGLLMTKRDTNDPFSWLVQVNGGVMNVNEEYITRRLSDEDEAKSVKSELEAYKESITNFAKILRCSESEVASKLEALVKEKEVPKETAQEAPTYSTTWVVTSSTGCEFYFRTYGEAFLYARQRDLKNEGCLASVKEKKWGKPEKNHHVLIWNVGGEVVSSAEGVLPVGDFECRYGWEGRAAKPTEGFLNLSPSGSIKSWSNSESGNRFATLEEALVAPKLAGSKITGYETLGPTHVLSWDGGDSREGELPPVKDFRVVEKTDIQATPSWAIDESVFRTRAEAEFYQQFFLLVNGKQEGIHETTEEAGNYLTWTCPLTGKTVNSSEGILPPYTPEDCDKWLVEGEGEWDDSTPATGQPTVYVFRTEAEAKWHHQTLASTSSAKNVVSTFGKDGDKVICVPNPVTGDFLYSDKGLVPSEVGAAGWFLVDRDEVPVVSIKSWEVDGDLFATEAEANYHAAYLAHSGATCSPKEVEEAPLNALYWHPNLPEGKINKPVQSGKGALPESPPSEGHFWVGSKNESFASPPKSTFNHVFRTKGEYDLYVKVKPDYKEVVTWSSLPLGQPYSVFEWSQNGKRVNSSKGVLPPNHGWLMVYDPSNSVPAEPIHQSYCTNTDAETRFKTKAEAEYIAAASGAKAVESSLEATHVIEWVSQTQFAVHSGGSFLPPHRPGSKLYQVKKIAEVSPSLAAGYARDVWQVRYRTTDIRNTFLTKGEALLFARSLGYDETKGSDSQEVKIGRVTYAPHLMQALVWYLPDGTAVSSEGGILPTGSWSLHELMGPNGKYEDVRFRPAVAGEEYEAPPTKSYYFGSEGGYLFATDAEAQYAAGNLSVSVSKKPATHFLVWDSEEGLLNSSKGVLPPSREGSGLYDILPVTHGSKPAESKSKVWKTGSAGVVRYFRWKSEAEAYFKYHQEDGTPNVVPIEHVYPHEHLLSSLVWRTPEGKTVTSEGGRVPASGGWFVRGHRFLLESITPAGEADLEVEVVPPSWKETSSGYRFATKAEADFFAESLLSPGKVIRDPNTPDHAITWRCPDTKTMYQSTKGFLPHCRVVREGDPFWSLVVSCNYVAKEGPSPCWEVRSSKECLTFMWKEEADLFQSLSEGRTVHEVPHTMKGLSTFIWAGKDGKRVTSEYGVLPTVDYAVVDYTDVDGQYWMDSDTLPATEVDRVGTVRSWRVGLKCFESKEEAQWYAGFPGFFDRSYDVTLYPLSKEPDDCLIWEEGGRIQKSGPGCVPPVGAVFSVVSIKRATFLVLKQEFEPEVVAIPEPQEVVAPVVEEEKPWGGLLALLGVAVASGMMGAKKVPSRVRAALPEAPSEAEGNSLLDEPESVKTQEA